MRHHWLVKSEPDAFSWEQQAASGVEPWTGVRNATARNNLAAMRLGDLAFFYHSNIGKEIVGVVEVARETYPDPTADASPQKGKKPRGGPGGGNAGNWVCVDMKAVGPMPKPVSLATIKADPYFADFALVRQSRLSVMPVSKAHWDRLCRMGGWPVGE